MLHRETYHVPKVAPTCGSCPHLAAVRRNDGSCAFVDCKCVSHFSAPVKRVTKDEKQGFSGTAFGSSFEAGDALAYEKLLKAGQIKAWRPHVDVPLVVNGFLVTTYQIDFEIIHLDDTIEYVEAKGVRSAVWQMKWKLFLALYSGRQGVKLTCHQQRAWKPRRWRGSV
jgi:hypothetical protein